MQSKIYKLEKSEVKKLMESSDSIISFLTKIGLSAKGSGSRAVFYRYIKENNLESELEELRIRSKAKVRNNIELLHKKAELSNNEIFKENSNVARHVVKRRIIRDKLIPYKCELCGNNGTWLDRALVLQLDHKNGVNNDNRLENLRFLCPNCHSQTETFSGKHNKGVSDSKKMSNIESLKIKRWNIITMSNIDFSKFGWVKELSILFGISSNKAGNYVKNNYPYFYKTCFQRN